ncbi:MAG TPA: sensor histidine kinase [Candidatus Cybelea sp.]|nr:sensor histidine kinase [Candidatus Cybelea sp.]
MQLADEHTLLVRTFRNVMESIRDLAESVRRRYREGILKQLATKQSQHAFAQCILASTALVSLAVASYRLRWNPTTTALLYVVVVVFLARVGRFVLSVVASVAAAVCLAHLAPPAYSFRVDDPLDDIAIVAFLVASLMIVGLVFQLRRMAEEARLSVSRRLIDAEERERTRIARDLHDDIGQRMALLEIRFDQLRKSVPGALAEHRTAMDGLLKQIDELCTDIQVLAHTLHSPKLEYLGLVKSISSFCKEFASQQKVEIDFKSEDLPIPLPPEVSLSLFRVMQEALHNSAKHSGAQKFEVVLFETSDAIWLIVRDSGLGFDPEAAMKSPGLGLVSMRERIKLLKGQFLIDSQLNRGTTIHARVPLGQGPAPRASQQSNPEKSKQSVKACP